MSGATLVLLKQAGESVTLKVTRCELASVGKFPEVEIEGTDGYTLLEVHMPKASADRQLQRAGIGSMAELVGRTVTISRDPNKTDPNKPYWGITPVGGVLSQPGAPKVAQAASQAAKSEPPEYGHIPGLDPEPLPGQFQNIQPGAAPAKPASKFEELSRLHRACFLAALDLAEEGSQTHGLVKTLEGVSALTAQLFIACKERGITV